MTVAGKAKSAKGRRALARVSIANIEFFGIEECLKGNGGIITFKRYTSPLGEPLWMGEIALSVETARAWRQKKDSCLSTAMAIYSDVSKALKQSDIDVIRTSGDNDNQPRRYLVMAKGELGKEMLFTVATTISRLFGLRYS